MVSKAFNFPHSNVIGFEDLWRELDKLSTVEKTYPPHNLVKHSKTEYTLELALAGYSKENLDVELKDGYLVVSGDGRSNELSKATEYLHKGISTKKFSRSFKLSENVVVDGADYINGLLVIELRLELPEEAKPKKISIGSTASKQFLAE